MLLNCLFFLLVTTTSNYTKRNNVINKMDLIYYAEFKLRVNTLYDPLDSFILDYESKDSKYFHKSISKEFVFDIFKFIEEVYLIFTLDLKECLDENDYQTSELFFHHLKETYKDFFEDIQMYFQKGKKSIILFEEMELILSELKNEKNAGYTLSKDYKERIIKKIRDIFVKFSEFLTIRKKETLNYINFIYKNVDLNNILNTFMKNETFIRTYLNADKFDSIFELKSKLFNHFENIRKQLADRRIKSEIGVLKKSENSFKSLLMYFCQYKLLANYEFELLKIDRNIYPEKHIKFFVSFTSYESFIKEINSLLSEHEKYRDKLLAKFKKEQFNLNTFKIIYDELIEEMNQKINSYELDAMDLLKNFYQTIANQVNFNDKYYEDIRNKKYEALYDKKVISFFETYPILVSLRLVLREFNLGKEIRDQMERDKLKILERLCKLGIAFKDKFDKIRFVGFSYFDLCLSDMCKKVQKAIPELDRIRDKIDCERTIFKPDGEFNYE